jgi:hypothetical protein
MTVQLTHLADRMQQSQADFTKRLAADLAGLMLLQELYEDPPGAPRGWWPRKIGHLMNPQD